MAFKARPIPGPEQASRGEFTIVVELGTPGASGLPYKIVCRWNVRESFWMASMYDASDRAIVRDIAVRCDEDVLENVIRPYTPPGAVVCRDVTGGDRDPDRQGWTKGIRLLYEYEVA